MIITRDYVDPENTYPKLRKLKNLFIDHSDDIEAVLGELVAIDALECRIERRVHDTLRWIKAELIAKEKELAGSILLEAEYLPECPPLIKKYISVWREKKFTPAVLMFDSVFYMGCQYYWAFGRDAQLLAGKTDLELHHTLCGEFGIPTFGVTHYQRMLGDKGINAVWVG